MLTLLCLVACAPDPALEGDILELQTQSAALEEDVAQLRTEIDALQEMLTTLKGEPKPESTKTPYDGPVCTERDDGSYTLPADSIDTKELATAGRAVPHKASTGDLDGYRLSAIRRGRLLDSCGFNNGDIVHAANDHSLLSVDAALEAYGDYTNGSDIRISLTRRGAPMELVLHPQP